MPNILKPFLCISANAVLALLLLFVFGESWIVAVIVSFAGFALSFYAAPDFGMSENREKEGTGSLFCWFAILGTIIVPGAFICFEASKYNFRGKSAENVSVSEIEKYADYDYFYFNEIKPLQEFTERLCKTKKSGKTASSTVCYKVFPVTNGKDGGIYKVWAVYGDFDDKAEFETAKSGIRIHSDFNEYLETVKSATEKFNIKSAEKPVFITLTVDADKKINETVRTLISAFIICVIIGTAVKGYLIYLSKTKSNFSRQN